MENEITRKIHELRELRRMKEELEQQIDSLTDSVKAYMIERGVDEMNGCDWKVSWKSCCTSRFDSKSFKKEHADLFDAFNVVSEVKRFIVA